MKLRSSICLAALLSPLIGCSSADQAEAPAKTEVPERRATVLDPQLQALDRARAVQATVDAQADKTRAAIDDASD